MLFGILLQYGFAQCHSKPYKKQTKQQHLIQSQLQNAFFQPCPGISAHCTSMLLNAAVTKPKSHILMHLDNQRDPSHLGVLLGHQTKLVQGM